MTKCYAWLGRLALEGAARRKMRKQDCCGRRRKQGQNEMRYLLFDRPAAKWITFLTVNCKPILGFRREMVDMAENGKIDVKPRPLVAAAIPYGRIAFCSGFILVFLAVYLNVIFFRFSISLNSAIGYCGLSQAALLAMDMLARKIADKFCVFLGYVATFNSGVVASVVILIAGKFILNN